MSCVIVDVSYVVQGHSNFWVCGKISAIPAQLPWQVFDKAFFYGWGLSADHNYFFFLSSLWNKMTAAT